MASPNFEIRIIASGENQSKSVVTDYPKDYANEMQVYFACIHAAIDLISKHSAVNIDAEELEDIILVDTELAFEKAYEEAKSRSNIQ